MCVDLETVQERKFSLKTIFFLDSSPLGRFFKSLSHSSKSWQNSQFQSVYPQNGSNYAPLPTPDGARSFQKDFAPFYFDLNSQ